MSFFARNSKDVQDEWVNVFEKAMLDMKADGINVELKSVGWHLFEQSNLTLAEGEYKFADIRRALIKLFPDTIVSRENAQFQIESRVM